MSDTKDVPDELVALAMTGDRGAVETVLSIIRALRDVVDPVRIGN